MFLTYSAPAASKYLLPGAAGFCFLPSQVNSDDSYPVLFALKSHGVSKGPQNDVNFLMIRMTGGLKDILLQKTAAGIASAVHFATLAGLSFHGRSKDIAVFSLGLQRKLLALVGFVGVQELCRARFCTMQLDTHAYTCAHAAHPLPCGIVVPCR